MVWILKYMSGHKSLKLTLWETGWRVEEICRDEIGLLYVKDILWHPQGSSAFTRFIYRPAAVFWKGGGETGDSWTKQKPSQGEVPGHEIPRQQLLFFSFSNGTCPFKSSGAGVLFTLWKYMCQDSIDTIHSMQIINPKSKVWSWQQHQKLNTSICFSFIHGILFFLPSGCDYSGHHDSAVKRGVLSFSGSLQYQSGT